MAYGFSVNMRADTYSAAFRRKLSPWGYLIAPTNATERDRLAIGEWCGTGGAVIGDNGNFELIGRTAARFKPQAAALLADVRATEKQLGRRARSPRDLPAPLRASLTELAKIARQHAQQVALDPAAMVERQRELGVSHLIGAEDITMAVWLSLNLEPQYLDVTRARYRQLNERVARAAVAQMATLSRAERTKYYAVASAVSYDTAFDAGTVFATAGLQRAAMGFGAYMADDHYGDHVYLGGRRSDLPSSMPMRYVRTAAVAAGFWAGYRSVAKRAPRAFHCLGLGAPMMMPIVAIAAWGTPLLTFDAMSPIKDAVEGTVYLSSPTYLKVRTRRQALRLAAGANERWRCPCPFCRSFVRKHPFRYDAARAAFAARVRGRNAGAKDEVEAPDLAPGGALYAPLPLLSEPAGGDPLRQEVTFARVGHNHWALQRVIDELSDNGSTRPALVRHADRLVGAYEAKAGSEHFAAAVRFGLDLVRGHPA